MNLMKLQDEMPFKWKVQTANSYAAKCVAFIDARDVQEKLDLVCGAENWQVKYGMVNGNMFASIGIYNDTLKEWVWKSDCGTESNVEKEKGEVSDAFKRAGVAWGIGRFLYSLPMQSLPTKEKESIRNGKPVKVWTVFVEGKFIYGNEEVTRLCNISIKKSEAPAATTPAPSKDKKTVTKSPITVENFKKSLACTVVKKVVKVLNDFDLNKDQRILLVEHLGKLKEKELSHVQKESEAATV